jgi:hypothetical protein
MTNPKTKKLILHVNTIRNLTGRELQLAHGGVSADCVASQKPVCAQN